MFSKIILPLVFAAAPAFASYEAAERNFGSGSVSLAGHRRTIIELVYGGHYYSVIPWMKDYLVKNSGALDADMEEVFDRLVTKTGVKTFESLPEELLRKSRSPNIRYILAKRLMRRGKNMEALTELSSIPTDHSSYPFVAHLRGTLAALLDKNAEAASYFNECIRASNSAIGDTKSQIQKNQYAINRDYCIAGVARAQFASQQFNKAELTYLDIPKESPVWPEILFDEAWNSYYQKNYNRTLGKLVSYKAPVFSFIFNPEIEVLKALTYMKMCLYEDAKKTADGFYNELLNPAKDLRTLVLTNGKNYRYYYNLIADHETGKPAPSPMVDTILSSIRKDQAFIEMKGSLTEAINEYNELRKKGSSSLRTNLVRNTQTVLDEYRSSLGAYVRSGMVTKYSSLYSAFQGMSYIKLEVLAQRKERLYESDVIPGKKRGDVKYIDRNDKQYFWTFNGEFWADELGDYVFALRSEC